jgi:hypothetical protein
MDPGTLYLGWAWIMGTPGDGRTKSELLETCSPPCLQKREIPLDPFLEVSGLLKMVFSLCSLILPGSSNYSFLSFYGACGDSNWDATNPA